MENMSPYYASDLSASLFMQKAAVPCLQAARRPKVVAVASGKGGVGKTWLAISLAQALALEGQRVLIFDADFGLANVDIQLGMMPKYDLVDLLAERVSVDEAIQQFSIGTGIRALTVDILPGRSGMPSIAGLESDALDRLVMTLRDLGRYDYIFVDLCAGIDAVTRHLAAVSDYLFAVTTAEPTSLADIYAVMKLYARDRKRYGGSPTNCRVVVNQAANYGNGRETFDKLSHACRSFLGWEPSLVGVVRKDTRVPSSIRQQSSILETFPGSPAAVDVRRLAKTVLELPRVERPAVTG